MPAVRARDTGSSDGVNVPPWSKKAWRPFFNQVVQWRLWRMRSTQYAALNDKQWQFINYTANATIKVIKRRKDLIDMPMPKASSLCPNSPHCIMTVFFPGENQNVDNKTKSYKIGKTKTTPSLASSCDCCVWCKGAEVLSALFMTCAVNVWPLVDNEAHWGEQ